MYHNMENIMKKLTCVLILAALLGCNNDEPMPALVSYGTFEQPMPELPIHLQYHDLGTDKSQIMLFDAITSDNYSGHTS